MGIVVLTLAQIFIGFIHVFSGFWLLASELGVNSQVSIPYDVYTLVFGLLVLAFAVLIWQQKRLGWLGTMAVSLFVIVADALTLLDLPSILGIPKAPALAEIAYSILVTCYLFMRHVRKNFSL